VRCKGRYYEALATLNTCAPTSPPHRLYPVAYVLGDSQRAKALVLAALLVLNLLLVLLVMRSNQWSMYAVMLVPNCGQFAYVKYRQSHAFFNPAHLNLRQLQWDLNIQMPQCKLNGAGAPHHHHGMSLDNHSCRGPCGGDPGTGGWSGCADDTTEEECDNNHTDDVLADSAYGGNHFGNGLVDAGVAACLQCPNPLFMSAVSASTMFFFGPSGATRSPSDLAPPGLPRSEGHVRSDM